MASCTRFGSRGTARILAAASFLAAATLIGALPACSGKAAGPAPAAAVNSLEIEDLKIGTGAQIAAGQQAVSQWVYKPTLLNGEPVEVVTTIDVNFTLSQ